MAMVVLHRGMRFKGEFEDEAENTNWLVKVQLCLCVAKNNFFFF